MAHFLDSEIIKSMQNFWPEHFEHTSASQLRSPNDIQYALAYYYFMMSEREEYDFMNIFNTKIDKNHDGCDISAFHR